ncbi:hypothetical protein CICLE_v10023230mg [Citrus x clementina]|uniref:Uncharacterized protein n=1 Tax=Citrus clementina TaxID=85681 RepID=V4VS15_CITCL|nr:hypothetical protein CICLE_v10023230mg [Citrus x clementina]
MKTLLFLYHSTSTGHFISVHTMKTLLFFHNPLNTRLFFKGDTENTLLFLHCPCPKTALFLHYHGQN